MATRIGGSFTLGATGIQEIPIASATQPPTYLRFTVGGRVGIPETSASFSYGAADGVKQFTRSAVGMNSTTRCINHYMVINGIPTLVLSATLVSMTVSNGFGYTLDVHTSNSGRQVTVEYE